MYHEILYKKPISASKSQYLLDDEFISSLQGYLSRILNYFISILYCVGVEIETIKSDSSPTQIRTILRKKNTYKTPKQIDQVRNYL